MRCRLLCILSLVWGALGCEGREPAAAPARPAAALVPSPAPEPEPEPEPEPAPVAEVLQPPARPVPVARLKAAAAPRLVVNIGPGAEPSRSAQLAYLIVQRGDDTFAASMPRPPSVRWWRGAPQLLTELEDGRVFFFARDPKLGVEPWIMAADGSSAAMIADLTPGSASSLPAQVEGHGDQLCFTLTDRRRYCTDGTAEGTRELPTPHSWLLSGGVVKLHKLVGGWSVTRADGEPLMVFTAAEGCTIEEVPDDPKWTPSVRLYRERPVEVRVWRGRLYVSAPTSVAHRERVMVTDGTSLGTMHLGDSGRLKLGCEGGHHHHTQRPYVDYPSASAENIHTFKLKDMPFSIDEAGRVGWTVEDGNGSTCYWSEGSEAGTYRERELGEEHPRRFTLAELAGSLIPDRDKTRQLEVLGVRGGLAWVRSYSKDDLWSNTATLWVTDGTAEGTRQLKPPGPMLAEPRPVLTQAGLVFSMQHPRYGRELFLWPAVPR